MGITDKAKLAMRRVVDSAFWGDDLTYGIKPEALTGNICVFASGREISSRHWNDAYDLGELIGKHNFNLVFGGFSGGLMGAVALGAEASGAETIGVVPISRWERPFKEESAKKDNKLDPYQFNSQTIFAGDLERRKNTMLEMSDAIIALPGGIGTLDEIATVFEKSRGVQTRGAVSRFAIVNSSGYYDGLRETLDTMDVYGTSLVGTKRFAHFAEDVDDAFVFVLSEVAAAQYRIDNPYIPPKKPITTVPTQTFPPVEGQA